jgi:acylpyruvate hydrolase
MKLVMCQPRVSEQGARFLAAVIGEDAFIDLCAIDAFLDKNGKEGIPNDLVQLISQSDRYFSRARKAIEFAAEEASLDERIGGKAVWKRAELRFLPAIPRPGKILHTSVNFSAHKKEVASGFQGDIWKAQDWGSFHYQHPTGFLQAPSSAVGTDEEVIIPAFTEQLDYEIELAIVIGRKAKRVSKEDALNYVAGYCVFNDMSARDIQSREHANKVILLGKSFDTSCPLGPWLTTSDEIADPQSLQMTLKLNGEVRQNATTRDMVYGVADLVSWWSNITLEPGDVITSGSPSGVIAGHKDPVWLAPGDRIEASIEGLGTMVNTIASESD